MTSGMIEKRDLKILAWAIGVLIGTVSLITLFMVWAVTTVPCSYDTEYATKKVENYLNDKGLNIDNLILTQEQLSSCQVSFVYKNSGNEYKIFVIDDFVRGAKITGELGELNEL
ncbi:hypothetical protein P886_0182 [Alteromonadaceae bacterium 2753L.S.0a.02]|nr:hypothetical protein P886_0182 [Alteromonadaceae bacterium 2753L.S.0a.02]